MQLSTETQPQPQLIPNPQQYIVDQKVGHIGKLPNVNDVSIGADITHPEARGTSLKSLSALIRDTLAHNSQSI